MFLNMFLYFGSDLNNNSFLSLIFRFDCTMPPVYGATHILDCPSNLCTGKLRNKATTFMCISKLSLVMFDKPSKLAYSG